MSAGELPPLPPGDDPWALLDVPRDVDEKELKRAYARRIKVYRPDRAPEAFARIHAAYEMLQGWSRSRAQPEPTRVVEAADETVGHAPEPTRPRAPATEAAREPALVAAVVGELATHLDGGDLVAAERRWTESGLDLARVMDTAPANVRDWLVGRAPVTWKEVSAWERPQTAMRTWLAALRVRVQDDARRADAEAMLDEPALLADVDHDEAAAAVALRAVSALAWRGGAARRLFRRLGSIPRHPVLEAMRDRAELDLELGDTVRALPASNPLVLPPALRRLLVEAPLLDDEELDRVREELYDDLHDAPHGWQAWIDGLYRSHHVFANALTQRLLDSVPEHRRLLGSLRPRARRQVAGRLRELKAPLPAWILCVVVALVLAVAGSELTADEDVGTAAFLIAIGLCVGGYYLERALYRGWVRVPLLRTLIDVGVTRAAAHEWVGAFVGQVPRLYLFRVHMSRDQGLRVLAFIAAATHPEDRRAGAEDEEEEDDDGRGDDDDDDAAYDDSLIREEDPDAPRGRVRRFFDWFNDLPFVR